MIVQDQSDIVAFLESPSTFGSQAVARLDTHTASLFLVGNLAYKLKRAVRFDYLDFSTPELRRRCCELEVSLNRRTAPTLYRRVVPISRAANGTLTLGGDGTPVDWTIEMTRFPQENLLDRIAVEGRLSAAILDDLAEHIAQFHLAAERRQDHGGADGMQWVVDGNAAGLAEFGGFLDDARREQVEVAARREVESHTALLDARRAQGFVRHCHGDLHLGNIVMLDGRPTLFDGVEFNDEIACVDVLYDVSFLLMDLWHRGLRSEANRLLNRYLWETGDIEGLALLPLFLSCRAAVRAKTNATAASMQTDVTRREGLTRAAREYLDLAEALLRGGRPEVVAIGGLSGSGKSTLARTLAPSVGRPPGALVVRSDEIRKRLCHAAPLERLGADGYSRAMSARVYSMMAELADRTVRSGHSAIVDAVFGDAHERERLEHIAGAAGVPFTGLWLEAPEEALIARVTSRQHDASDADAGVVRMQESLDCGPIQWKRIDTSCATDDVVREALRSLPNRWRLS